MIDMWLARHTPEKVLPRLLAVIHSAKEEFADAVANGGGIYAVGYCFGAKYVLLFAGERPDSVLAGQENPSEAEQGQVVKGPLIKVGAVAHGTQVTPDDIANVRVPMYFVCVKDDPLFPEEVRQAGIERLEKENVEHEVKVYPQVPHGKFGYAFILLTLLTRNRLCGGGRLCGPYDQAGATTGIWTNAGLAARPLSTVAVILWISIGVRWVR
jgi:dienelactone hydrolase